MTNQSTDRTKIPTREYLADGVYASFDGEYIWLDTKRGEDTHTIAIDWDVYYQLRDLAQRIWGEKA